MLRLVVAVFLVALPAAFPQAARPVETYPERAKILFWTPQEKPFAFRSMEKISPGHVVKRGGSRVTPLPYAAKELAVHYQYQGQDWDTQRFMESNNVAGLLIIHDGKILLEHYGLGLDENGRWTSFSVAKSFTSTLVGAAVKDGKIHSIDDPVTKYLPALKGSAYDGASVRNVLNMASGVKWNEDYVDPKSDVSQFGLATDTSVGGSALLTYLSKLPRDVAPGTKFNYNTGETNLVGELVMAATGKPLATYLSEKIWTKLGMEHDAFWMLSADGKEMGGCCLSVSLRDYGRFALFVLGGAKGVTAPDWISQATHPSDFSKDERGGYGFQWWTGPEGTFFATGIFGQNIQFFPDDKLIVVSLSAWPVATNRDRTAVRRAYVNAVRDAVRGK